MTSLDKHATGIHRVAVRTLLRGKAGLSASLNEIIGAVSIGVFLLGVTAVGVTAMVSFGNDSDAQTSLAAVRAAETTHETKWGAFATRDELVAGAKGSLAGMHDSMRIFVNDGGADYCATVKSSSIQGPQYLAGTWADPAQVRTPFTHSTLKGCQTFPPVFIKAQGSVSLAEAKVPAGSTFSCLRFSMTPGKDVKNWYIGADYLDAAKKPVPNTASPITGGGFYTSNGAMRASDVDGYCFGVGPEVKYVRWNFSSSMADSYGPGALNTVGSTYRNVIVLHP